MNGTLSTQLARAYFSHFPIEYGKWRLWTALAPSLRAQHIAPCVIRMANGASIQLDPADYIDAFIYFWRQWEPNETWLLRKVLRPGDAFVDVGANIGYFTLLASRLVGASGSITAIDATPPTVDKLRGNIALNGLKNVTVHACAVAESAGTIRIHRTHGANSGMNSMRPNATGEGWDVPALPLSQILPKAAIRLIKMDVEGAELIALRGMIARLQEPDAPDLMLEICPAYVTALGGDHREIFSMLTNAGYACSEVKDRILKPISAAEFATTEVMTAYFSKRAWVN